MSSDYGYPVISKEVSRYVKDLQNPTDRNESVRLIRLTGFNLQGKECKRYMLSKKWRFLVDAPFKISDRCCYIMKISPLKGFVKKSGRHPFIGNMAAESGRRMRNYLRFGCNAFELDDPISRPIAFWMEQDVLHYIKEKNLPYCNVYGDIVEDSDGLLDTTGKKRTGCSFCCFGVQADKGENRFQRMKRTHPKLWKYCMEKLGIGNVLDYIGVEKD